MNVLNQNLIDEITSAGIGFPNGAVRYLATNLSFTGASMNLPVTIKFGQSVGV